MTPALTLLSVGWLAATLGYDSCKKGKPFESLGGKMNPLANAGPNQVITLPTDSIVLDDF